IRPKSPPIAMGGLSSIQRQINHLIVFLDLNGQPRTPFAVLIEHFLDLRAMVPAHFLPGFLHKFNGDLVGAGFGALLILVIMQDVMSSSVREAPTRSAMFRIELKM